jgi:ubiquinone biosynthesis monooxygenase Coq6
LGFTTFFSSLFLCELISCILLDEKALVNDTAWQRYLPSGPVALLPLWNGHSSIVWSTSAQEAARLCSLTEEEFTRELNDALRSSNKVDRWSILEPSDGCKSSPTKNDSSTYGGLDTALSLFRSFTQPMKFAKREVASLLDTAMNLSRESDPFRTPLKVESVRSKRIRFPLSFQQAKRYSAERIALIGDAAHSIHPQAGQGLNLGLSDAKLLSDVIGSAMKTGTDIGDRHYIRQKYDKHQYTKNLAVMGSVDAINNIYSSNLKSVGFLRSFGMLGIHAIRPVKSVIAKYAMGAKLL